MAKDRKPQHESPTPQVAISPERAELADAIARRKQVEADIAALERAIEQNQNKGFALTADIDRARRDVEIVGDRKKALVAASLGDTAALNAIEAAHAALANAEKQKEAISETGQALREAVADKRLQKSIREINVENAVKKALAVDPALLAVVTEFNEVKIRHANLLAVIDRFSYGMSILPKDSAVIHTDTAGFLQPWLDAYRGLSEDPFTTLPSV